MDRDDLTNSSVEITIDVASLDTNWQKRDEHLINPDFFDADAHPTITFKSTEVAVTGECTAEVTGDLMIKATSKPVILQITLNGEGDSPISPDTYVIGFDATTTILRSDFGVDRFVPAISDEVEIIISTELERQ